MASRRQTRIFIDPSVFFAAALSPTGGARELFHRGMRGDLLLLVSDLVIEETRRNLAAKAPGVLPAFQLLTEVVALETVPTPEASLVLDVAKTIELKDAPIVAAAIVGGADYLATHDAKHLLSQAEIARVSFGLIIATPGDVLRDMRA